VPTRRRTPADQPTISPNRGISRQHGPLAAHYEWKRAAGTGATGPAPAGEAADLHSGRGAVRESDREGLRSAWADLAPALARLACALGVDPSRADDVLQDVYLAAWQHEPREADEIGLRRWLYRVTVNRCHLEHRRRTGRTRLLRRLAPLRTGADPTDDAPDAACRREERELVRRALDCLDGRLRSVLVLRYFSELDSKEIGAILRLSDSTVRSRLRTARRKLAFQLRRMGYRDE